MNSKKNNKKIKIGILGYGQIGQAVAKFYKPSKWEVLVKDIGRDDNLIGVEILHVCIPYNEDFVGILEKEIGHIKPKLTIIHSTTSPGTTKELSKKFSGRVVHSPVRGVHPNLFGGIKTFIKYIGADDKKIGKLAKKHLDSLGMKTKVFYPSASTELGKVLDTTYYGLCIAYHGEMKKFCDIFGVKFEDAVTDFNKTYNEGYKKLGMGHVVRPVLSCPEGYIGGHCVIPNAKILKKHYPSCALDLVLKYDGGEKSAHKIPKK